MNYNTSREDLIIPEYGRNIQILVKHAKTIEDDEYRQVFVEKVVELMQQMYPQTQAFEDYLSKIWTHVFVIADYDLNVTPPCEILPKEAINKRPENLQYPQSPVKVRYYGKHVQSLIQKAIEMGNDDEEKKQEFLQIIASFMKLSYKTWNKETVSDEVIQEDLKRLSNNQLLLNENTDIDNLWQQPATEQPVRRVKKKPSLNVGNGNNPNSNNNANNNNNNSNSNSNRSSRNRGSNSKNRTGGNRRRKK